MNSTLSTVRGRHDHPPQPQSGPDEQLVRRVGLVDRIALHLGVALITWGRRPSVIASRERRALFGEQQLARRDRERAWEHTARMNLLIR